MIRFLNQIGITGTFLLAVFATEINSSEKNIYKHGKKCHQKLQQKDCKLEN